MENLMTSEEFDKSIINDKNFAPKKKSYTKKPRPVDAPVDAVVETEVSEKTIETKSKTRANNLKVMFLGGEI